MPSDVVLVAGSFFPREGGAERQMRSVLRRIAQEGPDVHVVTQRLPDVVTQDLLDGTLEIHRVGSLVIWRWMPRLGQLVFAITATLKVLALRPSVVISIQLGAASAAAASASRLLKVRHYVRLTGGGTPKFRSEPVARAASRLGRACFRLIASGRAVVVSPAQHLLDDFAQAFPSYAGRTLHIPNGVSVDSNGSVRSSPPQLGDVVWYSRGGSETSTLQMMRVAEQLPKTVFSVIGRDPKTELPVNVKYLGWKDDPLPTLAGHRVLLNTSLNEGMPNTALQALALGRRVVGFDNAGIRELRDRFPGSVTAVAAGDTSTMVEAIARGVSAPGPPPAAIESLEDVAQIWMAELIPAMRR